LIASGGGQFIGKGIRDNPEWRGIAKEKNVCNNCAAGGHIAKNCVVPNPSTSSNQLNTFIPGFANHTNSQIQRDYEYFCSMSESTPLAMFICSVAQSLGIVLLDCGATRNYISLAYATRSQLSIKRVPVTPVRTPNGLLQVHGTVEFVLEMSEWRGKVKAFVLDLEGTDFDVVLGMEWFQEWNPKADWRNLEFTVETNTGTKHIRRLQTTPELRDFDIDNPEIQAEFNLMSFDELEKYFKKEQLSKKAKDKVQMILYYV